MSAPDAYDRADRLLEIGRPEAALELLKQAGEPENGRALRLFWLANQRLGRHDEALRWADRAHRDEQAVRGFRAALASDPQDTTLHENLGKAVFMPLIKHAVGLFLIVLVPGGRLAPDLVLGLGAVVAGVVMAWTYRRWRRSDPPLPADPAKHWSINFGCPQWS